MHFLGRPLTVRLEYVLWLDRLQLELSFLCWCVILVQITRNLILKQSNLGECQG